MSALDVEGISPILKEVKKRKEKDPFKVKTKDKRRFSKIRNAIKRNNQNSKK